MIRKTNFILYSLITSIIILISCSGEKSDELFYEIVTPSDKIFAFQDLKNIGFKKSREYNVSDLEGATEAWYGFWGEDEYSRKDYEIRFYSSHQNAVSLGENLARRHTKSIIVRCDFLSTYKEKNHRKNLLLIFKVVRVK